MGRVLVIAYFLSIQKLEFGPDEALLLSGFLNLVYFIESLASILWFDRFGLRPVLILGPYFVVDLTVLFTVKY